MCSSFIDRPSTSSSSNGFTYSFEDFGKPQKPGDPPKLEKCTLVVWNVQGTSWCFFSPFLGKVNPAEKFKCREGVIRVGNWVQAIVIYQNGWLAMEVTKTKHVHPYGFHTTPYDKDFKVEECLGLVGPVRHRDGGMAWNDSLGHVFIPEIECKKAKLRPLDVIRFTACRGGNEVEKCRKVEEEFDFECLRYSTGVVMDQGKLMDAGKAIMSSAYLTNRARAIMLANGGEQKMALFAFPRFGDEDEAYGKAAFFVCEDDVMTDRIEMGALRMKALSSYDNATVIPDEQLKFDSTTFFNGSSPIESDEFVDASEMMNGADVERMEQGRGDVEHVEQVRGDVEHVEKGRGDVERVEKAHGDIEHGEQDRGEAMTASMNRLTVREEEEASSSDDDIFDAECKKMVMNRAAPIVAIPRVPPKKAHSPSPVENEQAISSDSDDDIFDRSYWKRDFVRRGSPPIVPVAHSNGVEGESFSSPPASALDDKLFSSSHSQSEQSGPPSPSSEQELDEIFSQIEFDVPSRMSNLVPDLLIESMVYRRENYNMMIVPCWNLVSEQSLHILPGTSMDMQKQMDRSIEKKEEINQDDANCSTDPTAERLVSEQSFHMLPGTSMDMQKQTDCSIEKKEEMTQDDANCATDPTAERCMLASLLTDPVVRRVVAIRQEDGIKLLSAAMASLQNQMTVDRLCARLNLGMDALCKESERRTGFVQLSPMRCSSTTEKTVNPVKCNSGTQTEAQVEFAILAIIDMILKADQAK